MGPGLGGGGRPARWDGGRRPGWETLVLLHGRARLRSVHGAVHQNLPRGERGHGRAHGSPEGGPGGLRLRGAATRRSSPRGRAGGAPAIEVMLASAFRPIVIERWLRVCADNLRRIVETEDEWWRTEVEEPLLESMAEADMFKAQADLGSRVAPLAEAAVIAIYRGQQENVWSQSLAESIEGHSRRPAWP